MREDDYTRRSHRPEIHIARPHRRKRDWSWVILMVLQSATLLVLTAMLALMLIGGGYDAILELVR